MASVRSCDTRELTYRVVSGGCVCNQHPEWGVLTKNQRRAREKQMPPPNRWSHATQSTETEPSHRFASYSDKLNQGHQPARTILQETYTVALNEFRFVDCPRCHHRMYPPLGRVPCENSMCSAVLDVQPAKLVRRSMFDHPSWL